MYLFLKGMFANLLRVLFAFVCVAGVLYTGRAPVNYLLTVTRKIVPPGSTAEGLLVLIALLILAVLGLLIGVAVPFYFEHGTGATRRMFMSSLLRVLFMLFCLGLMVFVGGVMGSRIFWASQRPPDPLEPLTSSEGAAIGFGWMAAVMLGAAAGFFTRLNNRRYRVDHLGIQARKD